MSQFISSFTKISHPEIQEKKKWQPPSIKDTNPLKWALICFLHIFFIDIYDTTQHREYNSPKSA